TSVPSVSPYGRRQQIGVPSRALPSRPPGRSGTAAAAPPAPRACLGRSFSEPLPPLPRQPRAPRKHSFPSRFQAWKLHSWDFPFLKDRFRNSILTPRCRFGTGKSLTFVRPQVCSITYLPQRTYSVLRRVTIIVWLVLSAVAGLYCAATCFFAL